MSISEARYQTFAEFWPFYLREHANPLNRKIHFVGTFLVHIVLIATVLSGMWALLWLMPVLGYAFAWAGHFYVEKNRPATFKYPLWSLIADFKMFYLMISGKLK